MDINEKKIDIVHYRCGPSTTTQVPDALIRSEGESLSIKARQKKVRETLQKLNISIQKDEEPPVIAILGSGGGLRAMVGFLGVLAELAKEDILDAITYICGTSGATWCMSSLYNNDKWSSCMEEMESQIADRLLNPARNWKKAWEKLKQTFSTEMYSLTNFWAYVFIHKVINEINEKSLSNHKASCESGENPYPVYSAVEKDSLNSNQAGVWFEFTPHLTGFPAYKAFVKTEHFGSQFREGKLVKNHPESDLCYLQGLWGSALATDNIIKDIIKDKILKLFPNIKDNESFNEASLQGIGELLDPEGICFCDGCKKLGAFLSSHDLVEMTDADMETLFKDFENILHAKANESDQTTMNKLVGSCEKVNLMLTILNCLVHWQWGTTNNFLYELNSDIPEDICKKEFLSLVDAGLEINTAYPLMLPPNRKVDLILSFDYSECDPFMTLQLTEKYCKTNGIAFPQMNIDVSETEAPSQSCYVFEGNDQGAPVVMHFPLFNNQSCEGKVQELRKTYRTFNLSYEESELRELLKISKLNVKLNKDRILQQVQKILKCKSSI
ncbi:cytosolic phospholipase A2 gamma isoform X2 [Hyla sarda]|uniref:cytosolic phospholipase A2 gamma isoform X2 n=1 Tax=Hyla sarda TaxID=327740 RepID=UPI0024C3B62B|nr:cytosolic phospholipase A2 gamma isoform X2 [Hyla sarda]